MKILVLGGDGFCGWPTALHLSASGHEVVMVDNLSRRGIDTELGVESLTPIESTRTRIEAWKEVSGRTLRFVNLDVADDYVPLVDLIEVEKPEAVVHFAEQRAAPYSMKSPSHRCYTVENNVCATHNVLAAMTQTRSKAHLVHLGTMGVYGYGGGKHIPEGYIDGVRAPTDPGSVYHMTKCLDAEMFALYAKLEGLKITDLHQGIVWGTQTDETRTDERLVNRFDYDGDYGTVLNRFLMQSAVGYPLTVHGTGGQTRAFIHIQDTVRCIRLAIENPPENGVRIMNQMTETHRIRDLACMVSEMTGSDIAYVNNPRKEADENDLEASAEHLPDLGLNPTRLSDGLMQEVMEIAHRYRDRVDVSKIPCLSRW